MIKQSKIDRIILELEYAINTLHGNHKLKDSSKFTENSKDINRKDLKISQGIMRVNHMGEVCAQGLYRGQAAFTDDKKVREKLYEMCDEEREHLNMCRTRLDELSGKSSIFNGVWYASSFLLGVFAGVSKRQFGAGFIEETEKQVSTHLDQSIEKLPDSDKRSKEMLMHIKEDEEKHKTTAQKMGSEEIPEIMKNFMDKTSSLMKKITYYL